MISEWLRTLTGSLCLLTILLHLVPDGKFAKYVRFYGGLLFFLIAAGPVLRIFAGEGELERLLRLEFLKEEYYDMETAVEGMADLKNDRIGEAYRQEITRQIEEVCTACGLADAQAEVTFEEDGYTPAAVFVSGALAGSREGAVKAARDEISGVYMLPLSRIKITVRQGAGG